VTTGLVICPIHVYERNQCTVRCNAKRREFQRASQALRVYWYARKLGVQPMSPLRYQLEIRRRPWA